MLCSTGRIAGANPRSPRLAQSGRVMSQLTADQRREHFEARDAVRADAGRVLRQHDEVGELAGLDGPLDRLRAAGVGRAPRVSAQRLLRRDRLRIVEWPP